MFKYTHLFLHFILLRSEKSCKFVNVLELEIFPKDVIFPFYLSFTIPNTSCINKSPLYRHRERGSGSINFLRRQEDLKGEKKDTKDTRLMRYAIEQKKKKKKTEGGTIVHKSWKEEYCPLTNGWSLIHLSGTRRPFELLEKDICRRVKFIERSWIEMSFDISIFRSAPRAYLICNRKAEKSFLQTHEHDVYVYILQVYSSCSGRYK